MMPTDLLNWSVLDVNGLEKESDSYNCDAMHLSNGVTSSIWEFKVSLYMSSRRRLLHTILCVHLLEYMSVTCTMPRRTMPCPRILPTQ
jgi:hypothetical protein